MRDSGRPTLIGAVLGVLLLGAVVAFAVLVPELSDDAEPMGAETTTEPAALEPVELPDTLPLGLLAVDSGELGPDVPIEGLAEQEASAVEQLESLFGDAAAFRVYATPARDVIAQLVVLDRAPGLFTPETIPLDPALSGNERDAVEMVNVDGTVCSVNYGAPVAAGQPIDPTAVPVSVRCQLGAGERTYDISAQGVTVDQTLEVLQAAAAQDQ